MNEVTLVTLFRKNVCHMLSEASLNCPYQKYVSTVGVDLFQNTGTTNTLYTLSLPPGNTRDHGSSVTDDFILLLPPP